MESRKYRPRPTAHNGKNFREGNDPSQNQRSAHPSYRPRFSNQSLHSSSSVAPPPFINDLDSFPPLNGHVVAPRDSSVTVKLGPVPSISQKNHQIVLPAFSPASVGTGRGVQRFNHSYQPAPAYQQNPSTIALHIEINTQMPHLFGSDSQQFTSLPSGHNLHHFGYSFPPPNGFIQQRHPHQHSPQYPVPFPQHRVPFHPPNSNGFPTRPPVFPRGSGNQPRPVYPAKSSSVIDPELLAVPAEHLLYYRMFREAAENIIAHKRQKEFDLEVFIFPLLCGGHIATLEKYIAPERDLHHKAVKILDGLFVETDQTINQILEDFSDHCRPNHCALTCHKLKKIASGWVNQFKIDPMVISNIYLDKCKVAAVFLIKSISSQEQSKEAWIDSIALLVELFPDDLKLFILRQMNKFRMQNELMGSLMESWEMESWNGLDAKTLKENVVDLSDIQDMERHLDLPIPRENIIIVNDMQSYIKACWDLKRPKNGILGVDCEWNPARTGLERSELALLQIATEDECYLFDIFTLKKVLEENNWGCLSNVLKNKAIKKLGYDLLQDVRMMKEVMPEFVGGEKENGFIDLKDVSQLMFRKAPEIFGFSAEVVAADQTIPKELAEDRSEAEEIPNSDATEAPALEESPSSDVGGNVNTPPNSDPSFKRQKMKFTLSGVVEKIIGKPLAKFERMSNWERRPLREAQIVYAALDACCLIMVYNVFVRVCEEKGIKMEEEKPVKANLQDGNGKEGKENGYRGRKGKWFKKGYKDRAADPKGTNAPASQVEDGHRRNVPESNSFEV